MKESFWHDEIDEIESDTSLNDDLYFVPKKITELQREIESTKEQLDYLEILRAKQHQLLNKLQDEFVKHVNFSNHPEYKTAFLKKEEHLIELSSDPAQQILKLRFNYLLPIYHKTQNIKFEYYTVLNELYRETLVEKLIHERMNLPTFNDSEKVFVLIVQYFHNNTISDLDNRFHSFIFNALRSARIIPDDRWQKLSYMEDGRQTNGQSTTEIFVGNYENMVTILQESQKRI